MPSAMGIAELLTLGGEVDTGGCEVVRAGGSGTTYDWRRLSKAWSSRICCMVFTPPECSRLGAGTGVASVEGTGTLSSTSLEWEVLGDRFVGARVGRFCRMLGSASRLIQATQVSTVTNVRGRATDQKIQKSCVTRSWEPSALEAKKEVMLNMVCSHGQYRDTRLQSTTRW